VKDAVLFTLFFFVDGETESKKKQHPVVDVTGDGSKVRCYKNQYCIGIWNVRSMNQGKLEVVKKRYILK